jgi:hypothetical protein
MLTATHPTDYHGPPEHRCTLEANKQPTKQDISFIHSLFIPLIKYIDIGQVKLKYNPIYAIITKNIIIKQLHNEYES